MPKIYCIFAARKYKTMKTRLEQIEKKIRLSKAIDMDYILWETTIDDKTVSTLKENGYSVQLEHFNRYCLIGW